MKINKVENVGDKEIAVSVILPDTTPNLQKVINRIYDILKPAAGDNPIIETFAQQAYSH